MSTRQGKHPEPTLRTLWGLAKSRELSMTGEELHLVVQVQTGKESMKDLTQKEIARVAYVLGEMKDSARGGREAKARAAGPTDSQRRKIYMLQKELGWDSDPKRLSGFCRRMFRVDRVEWLDYRQCSDLIEALKAMVKRQGQAAVQEVDADGRLPCRADG